MLGTGESRGGIEGAVYSPLALCVSGLLVRVNVPYDVVGQTPDPVSCALGHLRETFCLCLVFEGIAWEVDACVRDLVSLASSSTRGELLLQT